MEETNPKETTVKPTESANDDLLGELGDLLAEEGEDLGIEDEDIENEAIDAEEDTPEGLLDDFPRTHQDSATRNSARQQRKNRDRQAFGNIEANLRVAPTTLDVSDDKMTVVCTRITSAMNLAQIKALLDEQGITNGIDEETINASLSKAQTGMDLFDVTVAQGKKPQILSPSKIEYPLPKELLALKKKDEKNTPFERLHQTMEGPLLEAVKSWSGPLMIVHPGDPLAQLIPPQIEMGYDVFGNPVEPEEQEDIFLQPGDNTSLSEDERNCVADIYGYAGLLEDIPTVIAPIWVSADHMEARFVHLTPLTPAKPPSMDELHALLEMRWIEFGVMEKQLRLLQKRLAKQQNVSIALPVARGIKPERGQNAQIHHAFDSFDIMKWSQLQNLLKLRHADPLREALTDIYSNTENLPYFKAVHANEVLIEKNPCSQGVVGRDIQGEEIFPDEGTDTTLEIGEGLQLSEDGLYGITQHFGFVSLRYDIEPSLVSPIWIPADQTIAYFLNLPQSGSPKYPTVAELQTLLEMAEITYGFNAERWAERCEALESGKLKDLLVPVAEGLQPQVGRDARFEWAIDMGNHQPGRILDDGSIDFRERDMHTVVEENDMIGTLVPPQEGVLGMDIFGNELKPSPTLNIEIYTDAQIFTEPTPEGYIAFYTEIAGGIITHEEMKKNATHPYKRIKLEVDPVTTISGDVDYSTGNIDFNGDVIITGSVKAHFSVKATGSILINGFIESGANIIAGKDIFIKQGVIGAITEVVAGGELMVKFIQEATVRAGLDLKVGCYIFNASVRSGGCVEILGQGEGKSRSLVGGLVWGATGINAPSIGSPYNTNTRLVTGLSPFQMQRTEQLRAKCRSVRKNSLPCSNPSASRIWTFS
jgi:hypothetical protein